MLSGLITEIFVSGKNKFCNLLIDPRFLYKSIIKTYSHEKKFINTIHCSQCISAVCKSFIRTISFRKAGRKMGDGDER